MRAPRFFASDNCASVHPDILASLDAANGNHEMSYGDDPYTRSAEAAFEREFGAGTSVAFVYNGTGANVLGLSSLTRPYHAIICARMAHINEDECGAPEHYTGCKLYTVDAPEGKLTVDDLEPFLGSIGFEHHAQPKVVSITQATEVGTVYRPQEIRALADFAHEHDWFLHMDGARIANAAVALGCSLRETTRDAGVDVLSFGGTKNGLMFGEAVVFFDAAPAGEFAYIRKQGMQLSSKMRYISAQFQAYLTTGLWKKNAELANRMARRLAAGIESISGASLAHPVEANGVFVRIPSRVADALREKWVFHTWAEAAKGAEDGAHPGSGTAAAPSEVARWMCSFDTTEGDIDEFVDEIALAFRG